MADLTFLSWNLNDFSRGRAHDKVRLLGELEWDIAAVQECDRSAFDLFVAEPSITGAFALDLTKPANRVRHFACALLVRNGSITEPRLWPPGPRDRAVRELPFPELCLAATVEVRAARATAVSFHAPHAAANSEEERMMRIARKNAAYSELVSGVNSTKGPIVVGMDANSWTDPVDLHPHDPEYEQHEVARFHLSDPRHGLRDAYRVWLDDHPDELERVRRLRPDGPLAVTYQRGKQNSPIVNRMDRIYTSPDWTVSSVEHGYAESVAAGSDHAYVLAALTGAGDRPLEVDDPRGGAKPSSGMVHRDLGENEWA